MKLRNSTNIPDETIKEIIRFVRPHGISNFDVMVKNYGGLSFRGRAYYNGSGYHETASPFVIVSVQRKELTGIYHRKAMNGYLPVTVYSRLEMVVYVMAHELRHLWQYKVKKGWRVWGARGQFSERDADAYAIKMLRAWRRAQVSA